MGNDVIGVGREDLRDTRIRVIALTEEFPKPACPIGIPVFVGAGAAANGRRANLHGTGPLGEHEGFVRIQGIPDRHVGLPNDIGLVERHQVWMAGGKLVPVVAVRGLVGPKGGDEHEGRWGVAGSGVPVVDPSDFAVGEDVQGWGLVVVGETALSVPGASRDGSGDDIMTVAIAASLRMGARNGQGGEKEREKESAGHPITL